MKKFDELPKAKRFKPTVVSRGGNTSFFEKPKETPLTGLVNNIEAKQGEERLGRTLYKSINKKIIRGFWFRSSPGIPRNVPGWKELDYLVDANGRYIAISIKGEDFVHKSASAKEQDRLNEIIILARLRDEGFDVPRIETVPAENLATQEEADKVGRDLGVYR